MRIGELLKEVPEQRGDKPHSEKIDSIGGTNLTPKIDHFSSHAFRDTFATRAVEQGMQPKTLQKILGHSDISITMNLYVHCMEETKAAEMQMLNIAIG